MSFTCLLVHHLTCSDVHRVPLPIHKTYVYTLSTRQRTIWVRIRREIPLLSRKTPARSGRNRERCVTTVFVSEKGSLQIYFLPIEQTRSKWWVRTHLFRAYWTTLHVFFCRQRSIIYSNNSQRSLRPWAPYAFGDDDNPTKRMEITLKHNEILVTSFFATRHQH